MNNPSERNGRSVLIRPIAESDSMEELTLLLHRSYKRLGDMGLRFFATHQTPEQTRERVVSGECFVAELEGKIVGTICLYTEPERDGPPLYRRPDVARFGQFAVEPELQEGGIGGMLLDHVERRAGTLGMAELALDTAEGAAHLIDYYSRRGWKIVGHTEWKVTNYRSVLMSKPVRKRSAEKRDSGTM